MQTKHKLIFALPKHPKPWNGHISAANYAFETSQRTSLITICDQIFVLVCGACNLFATLCSMTENRPRGHLWGPWKMKILLCFRYTQIRLVQCAWEGDWAKFGTLRMILAESTAVARRTNTQNRSKGSPLVHQKHKNIDLNPLLLNESCTMRLGGRLGQVWVCPDGPGRSYGRG